MVEWKVGQKYKWSYNSDDRIYICITFNSKGEPVLEYFNGDVTNISNFKSEGWEEYKEPLKGEFWLNIYPNQLEIIKLNKSKHEADEHAHKTRLACVHVKWTEGEGL